MKRSISSNNSNRDAIASRSKRMRPTATEEKENAIGINNKRTTSDQQNSVKKISETSKGGAPTGSVIRENQSFISANTPSESTISFSPPSSLTNTPLSTNNNRKSDQNLNRSSQRQQHNFDSTRRHTGGTLGEAAANSNSQPITTSSTLNKNQTNKTKSFTQNGISSNSSVSHRSSLNVTTATTTSNDPVSFLIEGSLEYRELKRLYMKEKNQAEEWRKDYQTLKGQISALKANTIPRPTADAMQWLRELFESMDNNGIFVGDGRTLEQIGEALGIDGASRVIVAARTPQKSALKLFRLLYPTTSSRARCRSISSIPSEQLDDIYLYVRTLHRNLNFNMSDMRRAIGTSIRTATCDLRRMQYQQQQQPNQLQNNDPVDVNEADEFIQDAASDADTDEESEANDGNNENEEDEEDDTNHLNIDDEGDEEDEDGE